MYTDEIEDQVDCKLLILADKYNVKDLVEKCVQVAENNMNVENVMEIAYSAYLINNQDLIDKASKFISNNRGKISIIGLEDLEKENPNVAFKVMKLLLFGNLK